MLTVWRLSIAFLICFLAGTAYSNPPSPGPPNAEEKKQADTKEKQQPTKPDRRGTETSPLFIKVIPPLAMDPGPAEHAQNPNGYTSPEWWLVWVTIILAAITAVLAGYTAKLWGATKSLAEDAEKTTTRQASEMQHSLLIAQESADAAKKSAEASERTINTIEITAERQLRAYVGVERVEMLNIRPNPSKDFEETWIHVRFKNFGQVPATRLEYWVVIDTAEFPLRTAFIGEKVHQQTGVIQPHDTFTAKMKLGMIDSPDEHAGLYIDGEIRYFDGFAPDRVTRFFYMRRGGDYWHKDGDVDVCQERNHVT